MYIKLKNNKMKIVHISDGHLAKVHANLNIPECDVLVYSGDIGGRTSPAELCEFLIWFESQPADLKVFIGGNHDHCLDSLWSDNLKRQGRNVEAQLAVMFHKKAMDLVSSYKVKYLCNTDYVYKGVKFYGSPYSPSFHRDYWAFNADRGEEIKKIWSRIPSDTNVLITHSPPYGIMDLIPEKYKRTEAEDVHRGCQDLLDVIKKRLFDLMLSCFGHIHWDVNAPNYGVQLVSLSNNRSCLFSNGAVVNNAYEQLIKTPLIITI